MAFTDIRWDLVRRLPESWRPYALLMRLDRPIGWWLLLLPGWWSIVLAAGGIQNLSGYGWYLMILFWIGAILMRGAGCIINDLWDRNLDAKVERTQGRPLASGTVKLWRAAIILFCLLFTGLIILLQTSGTCIKLGFLSILLIAAYPYMKRITWWPQAFLGITFNFGALMGWAAVTDSIDPPALFLYAGCFFWTLGYDTIYAHQDKEDDMLAGIKSTALLFGHRSKSLVGWFYTIAICLIALSGFMALQSWIAMAAMIVPVFYIWRQLEYWDPDEPESALETFKANRTFGLLVLLSFFMSTL